MSIAEKLTRIAQNQQQVYDAGQKKMHDLWLDRAITELDDPKSTVIDPYRFYNFSKLEKALFPSVTTAGTYAFRNCSALRWVEFPLLEAVASYAFRSTQVRRFDLPKVTSIDTQALAFNNNLKALILRGNSLVSLTNVNALSSTGVANGTGYIYVPSALLSEYKAATNWSSYADRFRAIEDYPQLDNAEALVITKQPTDIAAKAGAMVSFAVEAQGEELRYKWFLFNPDTPEKGWTESTYASNNEATHSLTLTGSRDGWQFRCDITDCYGHLVRTNIVTMRVET